MDESNTLRWRAPLVPLSEPILDPSGNIYLLGEAPRPPEQVSAGPDDFLADLIRMESSLARPGLQVLALDREGVTRWTVRAPGKNDSFPPGRILHCNGMIIVGAPSEILAFDT